MKITYAFALLAPVPEAHLNSGMETCQEAGKVAFGSMNFELFRTVDKDRGESGIEVFIYASWSQEDKPLLTEVTWHGVYTGHVASRNGRYTGGNQFRPKTTLGDKAVWAIYWEVQDLKRLSAPIPIGTMKGRNKTQCSTRFIPEGPLMIEYPGSR